VAIRSKRSEMGTGLGVPGPAGVVPACPAMVRRGRPASPSLHQVPWTALVPWLPGLAVFRAHVSPGWRCPEVFACVCAVGDVAAIAPMLREDCLPPIQRSFAIPLVPPSLSSPRFGRWIDPAGPRALPAGALVTRWTPRGVFGAALIRDF
jgi:hypothetical protein